MRSAPFLLTLLPALAACSSTTASFRSDAEFLREHTPTIEIASGTGSFLVCPELQGRVMSTAVSADGRSLGFVNRPMISAPDLNGAFANYGGVERFWIGPESGPFAFFFDRGQEHTRDNWHTPAGLNLGAFDIVKQDASAVTLERPVTLMNLKGTVMQMRVRRELQAAQAGEVAAALGGGGTGMNLPWTGFISRTTVTNAGAAAWTKEGGLPCIWNVGMFAPGARTWAIAPFGPNADPDGGPAVRADYFGQVPPERFRMGSNFALFRADAAEVGKIGVLRNRATDRVASWNPDTRIFTLVKFGPIHANSPYLSEHWGLELPDPYYGDVVNVYNHGGPEQFYELESSSRALSLAPGASHTHQSLTIQLMVEDDAVLDALLRSALGIDPAEFRALAK